MYLYIGQINYDDENDDMINCKYSTYIATCFVV